MDSFTPDLIKTIGITVTIIALVVVLPLIVLFLEHQRKMVKLLRGDREEASSLVGELRGDDVEVRLLRDRVAALEQEVMSLKSTRQGELEDRRSKVDVRS